MCIVLLGASKISARSEVPVVGFDDSETRWDIGK